MIKKELLKLILGLFVVVIVFFCFLYLNNDIGVRASNLEKDIRSSQKILDDWNVEGNISDTLASFISYPQDKSNSVFSVYVNRPGLSFGYFFRCGGSIYEIDESILELSSKDYNERAFISMNKKSIVRLEIDTGHNIQVIDIEKDRPFAIVLPKNAGLISFYDADGNVVEYVSQSIQ